MDWGFYAMTPRVVRTQYKDLSHTEKWLYTCLKDLCGDKGACFRTLRKLNEETDISTGSLTPMIMNLHKAGLIHAEKKRRPKGTREIWHITIIDIWQANYAYCSNPEHSQCSENEHSTDSSSQCSNPEQREGVNVQSVNNGENNLSLQCSNFATRRRYTKNKDTYEEDKGTYSADLLSQDRHTLTQLSPQEMIAALSQIGYTISLPSNEPTQQEIAASDTESHSHSPHQGSEQIPPTSVASSNHAPPFTDRSGTPLSLDGETMTPPPSVVANTPRRSGDVTNHAGDAQQSHDVATQDASFLPSQPNENTATPSKPSNDTRSSEIASQPQNEVSQQIDTSKQTSYSLDGHAAKPTQAEQPPLTTFSEPSTETPSQQKPKRSRKPTPPTEKPAQPEPTPEEVAAVAAKKAMDERCSAWQKRINKWRGYELETKGSVINERRCIRKLCEKYTDQQNKQIYVYLFETDWRWSKPDNRFKIGASEMLTEAGRVLQQLSGKPAVIVDEDLPDNVTPITSAQSNEPTTDLRVIAARARERALANGGN
jgi:hypothetical protein